MVCITAECPPCMLVAIYSNQFCCERYHLHLHDVLRPLSFDDMLRVSKPINETSLSYADVP